MNSCARGWQKRSPKKCFGTGLRLFLCRPVWDWSAPADLGPRERRCRSCTREQVRTRVMSWGLNTQQAHCCAAWHWLGSRSWIRGCGGDWVTEHKHWGTGMFLDVGLFLAVAYGKGPQTSHSCSLMTLAMPPRMGRGVWEHWRSSQHVCFFPESSVVRLNTECIRSAPADFGTTTGGKGVGSKRDHRWGIGWGRGWSHECSHPHWHKNTEMLCRRATGSTISWIQKTMKTGTTMSAASAISC